MTLTDEDKKLADLAIDCGMSVAPAGNGYWDNIAQLALLLHKVRMAERERCAKVCVERGKAEVEKWAKIDPEYLDDAEAAAWLAEQCAAEIMMRSNV